MSLFPNVRDISSTGLNILKKRYFWQEENSWEQLIDRVVNFVVDDSFTPEEKNNVREMILNRYFVPNSPCLVNAGKPKAGLCACFVVDFPDTIEGIYKTKLDFALIARKGGGAGTSLSQIRPEGSKVAGSTHGYAGGPIKFADTISHASDDIPPAGLIL